MKKEYWYIIAGLIVVYIIYKNVNKTTTQKTSSGDVGYLFNPAEPTA
ncbi:MAG: hypothetical protein M0P71_16240 [Melioribacteraceae bacterium]|jgi:hypothetical protein|nr:hypothetical protein [Melioribacteraceae bacterium]